MSINIGEVDLTPVCRLFCGKLGALAYLWGSKVLNSLLSLNCPLRQDHLGPHLSISRLVSNLSYLEYIVEPRKK